MMGNEGGGEGKKTKRSTGGPDNVHMINRHTQRRGSLDVEENALVTRLGFLVMCSIIL